MAQTTNFRSKKTSQQSEIWEKLKIAWKGYKIAKLRSDEGEMRDYANRINILQQYLGAKISKFPELKTNS